MLNNTTFAAALKVGYRQGIDYAVMKQSPFVGFCEKVDFPGKQKDLVIDIAHFGASPRFDVAQALKGASTVYAFNVTRSKLYVLGSIDGETDDSSTGSGAVAQGMKHIVDSKLKEFAHALSWSVWNNAGGSIGQVGSVSTTTLTLSNVTDHVNFNVGDELEFSETDGTSGSVQDAGATATVTAVDRKNGTLTSDSDWDSQCASIDADDYIFKKGTFGNSTAGVLGWVPPTDTPGTLYGVTRTTDPTRLAGIKYSASNQDMESAIIDARARARENSASDLDILFLGPRRYATLEKALQGKATYEQVKGSTMSGANIGYEAIRCGKVKIIEDPFCPDAYGLLTRRGVWKIGHTKSGLPHFDKKDGNMLSREPSADGQEFRLKGYWAVECHCPMDNVLITW